MNIESSAFYDLNYHALAGYIREMERCRDEKKPIYSLEYHQEAIDVLKDRMERAKDFDDQALRRMVYAPIVCGHFRGTIIAFYFSKNDELEIMVQVPEIQDNIMIAKHMNWSFDLPLMPTLSVHAQVLKK